MLSVSQELLHLYWLIGRDIVLRQGREGWGRSVIDRLSKDLAAEFPGSEGFSATNLSRMRAFYLAYPEAAAISAQVVPKFDEPNLPASVPILPWGHHVVLLFKIKHPEIRRWYAAATIEYGWSRSVLIHQIESRLYERQGQAITNFSATLPSAQSDLAQQALKDPYNFDFLTLRQDAHERDIELALTENIRRFLLELGVGFAFVGNQYHLKVGHNDFYIDLLFYHLKLRCFVIIDLKTDEFKPEYAGKLNFYLSAVDDLLRHPDDASSIGIVLCKSNDRVVAEYALRDMSKPMGVATYLTGAIPEQFKGSLPDIAELEATLSHTTWLEHVSNHSEKGTS